MAVPGWAEIDLTPYPKGLPGPQQKPMQVLCLGLSRTGIMSTYAALRQLGYTSYHFIEAAKDNQNGAVRKWRRAIEAKYFGGSTKKWTTAEDFDEVLWRHDTATDIPCCLFADELVKAYPDAKVILNEREVEGWIQSVESSFYAIFKMKIQLFLEWVDWQYTADFLPIARYSLRIWTKNDMENRDALRQGFLDHNTHIKAIVPREKLLVFHPREGWEPICKFLDKSVPETPFPKVNEGDLVARMHAGLLAYMRLLYVGTQISKMLLPVAVAGMGWWLYQRFYA